MVHSLFTSDNYTFFELLMYYLGATFWVITYILVVRKIIVYKSVEFPVIVICANVPWEFLWGFVFKLDFGGPYLLWFWRFGNFLDMFMLYSALRYGAAQFSSALVQKHFRPFALGAVAMFAILNYFYTKAGYDLAMGFNSAMILNVLQSALCIQMVLNLPNQKFSFSIGLARMIATDVCFTAYIVSHSPQAYFPIAMCIICFILDGFYLYLVNRQNKLNAVHA
ncbi:MAG: hypothetical protein K1X61_10900 [Chitinophagales bacterium]|nr:hypothetical protein [Chitinophagales bacterium]